MQYLTNNDMRNKIDKLLSEAKAERNCAAMRPIEHQARMQIADDYETEASKLESELQARYDAIPDKAGIGKNPNEPDILRAWQEFR